MPKWDDADWYVEYEAMTAHGRMDDDSDDQEADWSRWRVRAGRIHDDILQRIGKAEEACELRRANPNRSWADIASEIGWKRSLPLLQTACEWLDRIEPEKRKRVPGCKKASG